MTTEAELVRRIEKIKAALGRLGDLRPGSLSLQYNTCGAPGCRCKADPPERHGPYHQLNYTHDGRNRTENVAEADLSSVRAQLENYKAMRELMAQWVDAGIELDHFRRARARTNRRRPRTG